MTASGFDRITVEPKQMNGQPCIRGPLSPDALEHHSFVLSSAGG